jgi:hypothetical protein
LFIKRPQKPMYPKSCEQVQVVGSFSRYFYK